MSAALIMFLLVTGSVQPQVEFKKPPVTPEFTFPPDDQPLPRFASPKGYKAVQVPDYIADTYMRFASAETAHDFRLLGIETRLSILENFRDKADRPDIDSLKETRTKALIYIAIGSTLFTVIWTLLTAFTTWIFKEQLAPRLRNLWTALAPKPALGINPGLIATMRAEAEDDQRSAD